MPVSTGFADALLHGQQAVRDMEGSWLLQAADV